MHLSVFKHMYKPKMTVEKRLERSEKAAMSEVKNVSSVALEWASSTTCHGVHELIRPGVTIVGRVFWVVTVTTCAFFGIYQARTCNRTQLH